MTSTKLPDAPRIGVTGASGAVGGAAARALHRAGFTRLRLGGRRREPLRALADELGADSEAFVVDVTDEDALAAFCAPCDAVLNCAGPSYGIVDRVARSALAAGADYVDVTGDLPVHTKLSGRDLTGAGRRAVLSAGVLPGLSALLPRWALRGRVERLVGYCGGLERCTEAAAEDLLLSLPGAAADPDIAFGEPLAAWHDGRAVPGALRVHDGVQPPFFPSTAFVQPFLTKEAERLADSLGIGELEWHNVHAGAHVRAALTAAAGRGPGSGAEERRRQIAELRAAADLDLAGRTPYYLLVLLLTERVAGQQRSKTVVARLSDSYRMTGRVGAAAVRAVLGGAVPEGVHYAADVLDPATTVPALFNDPATATLRVLGGIGASDPGTAATVEEGAL